MAELVSLPGGAVLHVAGVPGALPLLLLHGVGGGAWSWSPQATAFAAERRVYVWEARGHGAAARVADAGLADYDQDAREALDAVLAREGGRVALAGHSMGGFLALALAARRPRDIAALALIDPVYAEAGEGHVPARFRPLARALLSPLVGSLARGGFVARSVGRAMFAASFTDRAACEQWWPAQRAQVPFEYPRMVYEGIGGIEDLPSAAFGHDIDAPTLVLNGRFARMRERLSARLGAHFEEDRIPGGHYLQLDRPDAVNERLRRFFGEHART